MTFSAPIELLSQEQRMPATQASISAVEELLGVALPEDYRVFLIEHGGSLLGDDGRYVVAPVLVPCPLGERATIEVFFGFYSDPTDPYDLRVAAETYRGRIPANTVAIGTAIGGDLVLLSCNGTDLGSVYLWDHEFTFLGGFETTRQMFLDLDRRGIDTRSLDVHRAVMKWEQLHAHELTRAPGYGPLYLLASSFARFLGALEAVPYDTEAAPA
jgi:hypothetical protein